MPRIKFQITALYIKAFSGSLGWAPQTRYTLRRNTAKEIKGLVLQEEKLDLLHLLENTFD